MIICDEPQFRGGQLNGVSYIVTVTGFIDATFRPNEHWYALRPTASGLGPIASIRVDYVPPSELDSHHQWYLVIQFANYTYRVGILGLNGAENLNQFTWGVEDIAIARADGLPMDDGVPPPSNCRCSDDSCRVECPTTPLGFCCIPNALTNALQEVLNN